MSLTFIILAAFVPAVALLGYVCWKDRLQMEPPRYLFRGFYFGIISCIPAIVLETLFDSAFAANPATMALSPALFEEGSKMLMIWLLIRKNPYFDEYIDGIVYAACVGVGFEFAENVEYFLADPSCIGIRTLMPAHFAFAIIMGYYLSLAHFADQPRKRIYYLLSFFMPAAAHWFWDFCCFAADTELGGLLMVAFFVFFISLFFIVRRAIRKQLQRDAERRAQQTAQSAQDEWMRLRF